MAKQHKVDLIILGAGPAGLTAGLYAARARRSVAILDTGTVGGQTVLTYHVANYPGVPDTSGRDLSQAMLAQAKHFGCHVKPFARITEMDLAGPEKTVTLRRGDTYTAPAVIIATGGVPRKLEVPGEEQFFGQGISYCATCDGEFFTDRPIAVIGGGNSALEEAIALAEYASEVTVIHEFDHFQAEPYLVEEAEANPKLKFLLDQKVEAFQGEGALECVVSTGKTDGVTHETPVDGAFVFIGYVPNSQDFTKWVEVNKWGEILTDSALETSEPGVFAAGDVRAKRDRQITTAVSDGTVSALSVLDSLGKLAP